MKKRVHLPLCRLHPLPSSQRLDVTSWRYAKPSQPPKSWVHFEMASLKPNFFLLHHFIPFWYYFDVIWRIKNFVFSKNGDWKTIIFAIPGQEIITGRKRASLAITEPSGGSDVANLATTAVREKDVYVPCHQVLGGVPLWNPCGCQFSSQTGQKCLDLCRGRMFHGRGTLPTCNIWLTCEMDLKYLPKSASFVSAALRLYSTSI